MNNIAYFKNACETGDINQVKQIIKKYNINIHTGDEYAFRKACQNNQLELVKYLISLDQNINIHANATNLRKRTYNNIFNDKTFANSKNIYFQ